MEQRVEGGRGIRNSLKSTVLASSPLSRIYSLYCGEQDYRRRAPVQTVKVQRVGNSEPTTTIQSS